MEINKARVAACAFGLVLALTPSVAWAETSEEVRAEVAEAQAQLDGLTVQIEEGEARLEELQSQVDELANESIEIESQIVADRDRLSQIVANGYKESADARTLALLLSSETVDELISQVYYAQKVSDWEADCISRLNDHKIELEERVAQLSATKEEQQGVLDDLAAQSEELDGVIAELSAKADQLEEEEREAARRAAEEAARKAEEERKAREAREAEERARQEAIEAARAAGDIAASTSQTEGAPVGNGWISCVASAYTIADNDPPGSTATASGIPLDESVPTVAMPMSMNPSRFYGSRIEISYNGISVIATVTDCGYMGGGSRGLDLTPAIFRAFGFSTADDWGLRTVSYRFL